MLLFGFCRLSSLAQPKIINAHKALLSDDFLKKMGIHKPFGNVEFYGWSYFIIGFWSSWSRKGFFKSSVNGHVLGRLDVIVRNSEGWCGEFHEFALMECRSMLVKNFFL
jgi:hypothetical protein